MDDNPIKECKTWWERFGEWKASKPFSIQSPSAMFGCDFGKDEDKFVRHIVTIPKHAYIDTLNKAVIESGIGTDHFVEVLTRKEIREALGLNKEG